MVYHLSLSDSKSPLVSRTLLSILADLNNTVIWMVTTQTPNSNSSSPLPTLWGSFQVHQLQLVSQLPSYSLVFLLFSSKVYLFSLSFNFTPWSAWTVKFTVRQVLFFLLFYFIYLFIYFWLSLGLAVRLGLGYLMSLKIADKFVRLTFQKNFNFLAQLPVAHLAHPVESCTHFALICCIRLWYDWSFSLSPHKLHLLFCSV